MEPPTMEERINDRSQKRAKDGINCRSRSRTASAIAAELSVAYGRANQDGSSCPEEPREVCRGTPRTGQERTRAPQLDHRPLCPNDRAHHHRRLEFPNVAAHAAHVSESNDRGDLSARTIQPVTRGSGGPGPDGQSETQDSSQPRPSQLCHLLGEAPR